MATNTSVRQLAPGVWELRVTVPDASTKDGRRVRTRRVEVASEDEARSAVRPFVIELGLDPEAPATLAGACDAWFRHSSRRRTAGSNRAVRIVLDRHICAPTGIGHLPLPVVDVVDLEAFYERKAEDYAPGTIRHIHYAIKPALHLAQRYRWIDRNPADFVELAPLDRTEITPPSDEEVLTLLDQADTELADFAWVLAVTGVRAGEASAFRWRDIDLEAGFASVTGSIEVVYGMWERKTPKTRKSHRRIALDAGTVELLRERRACLTGRHDSYVFPDLTADPHGTVPVRPSTWSVRWVRLRRSVGLAVRLHDLRHYHASSLFDDGARVERVSARLGHARTSTTQDVYGHLLDPDDADLAAGAAQRLRR